MLTIGEPVAALMAGFSVCFPEVIDIGSGNGKTLVSVMAT
jgi:hypothetical protein